MPSGGARNRSGPAANENSERSDRRGFKLTALPAEGYDGDAPAWPLEPAANATERSYWERAWRTPQACAWSMPSESWRIPTVARWVRLSVRCDAPDAGAAASSHQTKRSQRFHTVAGSATIALTSSTNRRISGSKSSYCTAKPDSVTRVTCPLSSNGATGAMNT